jgi:hypothetical protein
MPVGGARPGAGRPKGGVDKIRGEFLKLIKAKDVKAAMEVLRNKMAKREDGDVDAAKYILDQKYGKAKQRVDATIEGGVVLTITDLTKESET